MSILLEEDSKFQRFQPHHVNRVGVIIWVKARNKNYYVAFNSLSRPQRGLQLPGGRVERGEDFATAALREAYEETGIRAKIVCPLGLFFLTNPEDQFSKLEIYYLVRPVFLVDTQHHWTHIDHDTSKQNLQCFCQDVHNFNQKLALPTQEQAIGVFRDWLKEKSGENL